MSVWDEQMAAVVRLAQAREIIEEIALAGVEYDARKYLVVQIAPDLKERAKKWLEAEK